MNYEDTCKNHKKQIRAENKSKTEWKKGKSVFLLECIAIWSENVMVSMVTIF